MATLVREASTRARPALGLTSDQELTCAMVPKGLAATLWPVPMGVGAGPLYVSEVLVTGPAPAPGFTGLGPTGCTLGFHVLIAMPPLGKTNKQTTTRGVNHHLD